MVRTIVFLVQGFSEVGACHIHGVNSGYSVTTRFSEERAILKNWYGPPQCLAILELL